MRSCLKILAATVVFAATAAAQASISGITNNYSYIAPGLPNYGIAQGSIFSIFGTFTGVATSPLEGVPLTTKVNNVSVNVTVNGTTTAAIIYFVSSGLIDAILPSGTPVGTGTLTVVLPNTTTASTPITVVQSAFGILTLNQAGSGAAWAFDANNNYATVGYASAANPGDVIVIYGTGLGPVSGSETAAQTQTDLGASLPIEVDVGGAVAKVDYHGRTVFPGLDQVNFEVPAGVSGCNVSLVVRNGNFVSNATTIAVAAAGSRACSDANTGYSTTTLSKCASSGCSVGSINLTKTTTTTQPITVQGFTIGGGTSTSDLISASFQKITAAQAATGIYQPQTTSVGSCTVLTFAYSGNNPPPPPSVTFTSLNAGTITVGGAASTSMQYQNGGYSASSSTGGLIPTSGGTFNFTNGSGGPDVGSLSGASITLGAPLTSNVTSTSTVTRASGQTVTWSGGTPGTYVIISGNSVATVGNSTSSFVGAYFYCTAPVSAGSFNVPAAVLLSLPPTGTITQSGVTVPIASFLSISNSSNPVSFTATGIDQGILTGSYGVSNQVTYK